MSIGNLKDQGNQGNNFPWQLKMLQGLQAIVDGNCCRDIVDALSTITGALTPQERIHNIGRVSTTGVIVKPFSFSIANVGSANGTVEAIVLKPGEIINYDAGTLNNRFANISYNANGTEFLITWVS